METIPVSAVTKFPINSARKKNQNMFSIYKTLVIIKLDLVLFDLTVPIFFTVPIQKNVVYFSFLQVSMIKPLYRYIIKMSQPENFDSTRYVCKSIYHIVGF